MNPVALPPLRLRASMGLLCFFFLTLAGLVVTLLITVVVAGLAEGIDTLELRFITLVQDISLFILPTCVMAVKVSPLPARFLEVDRLPQLRCAVLAVMALICSVPAMNALVEWNEGITLPESLSSVEQWMLQSEDQAKAQVELIFGDQTMADLVVNLLIVGVLAGFSEELFFRGGLQRLLQAGRLNTHVAIWLTAFIFSAFHMQFFGFFPRLLLGAFFGYALVWSGSLWLPVLLHILNNSVVIYSTWSDARSGAEAAGAEALNPLADQSPESALLIIASIILTTLLIMALRRSRIA